MRTKTSKVRDFIGGHKQRAAKIALPRGTIHFNKGCWSQGHCLLFDNLCHFLTLLFYVKHTGELSGVADNFML